MPQTLTQYAVFYAPVHQDDVIPLEDVWRFESPVFVFDPGTPLKTVQEKYNKAKIHPRTVGTGKVEARLILKVRHLHYTDYVKVLGADVVKEKETA